MIPYTPRTPSAGVLSPATLNVNRLIALAGKSIAARGYGYYRQAWRMTVISVGAREAVVRVQGSMRYQVEFTLDERGEIEAWCECPYSEDDERIICKHKVAAALFLRDYLQTHAASSWEDVLTKAARGEAHTAQAEADELLCFSLQQRGASWAIVPYTIAANFFPEEARRETEAIRRVVTDKRLSSQAVKVQQYYGGVRERRYPNVTSAQASLVKTLASSSYYYGHYGSATLDFGVLFPLLEGAPLYTGTDKNPLKESLHVTTDMARIELEMQTIDDGIHLRAVAVAGERIFPIASPAARIISHAPLWLLADSHVFQLDARPDALTLFQDAADIHIPAEAEHTFFERHLTTLAERFPLRGESLKWERLNVSPVARLYLTEADKEIQAGLRFAYGDYEIPFARRAPPESVRRNAETGALVRIERQLEFETQKHDALAAATYGLKRMGGRETFTLRSKTHPFDFLLRHVPQLAADGYEIFGEAELASARVNRNRPTVSFGITSGIDWFDVQTVVKFGDTEASLAELRRAVRKRERFIKLADGTVGEIPPEFLERYRHLFALGETDGEHPDRVRVRSFHLTLLDELLANREAADLNARTDQEFERRRERLRNFAGIKEQKLPKRFDGELRPYQRAGFDWLHFLREQNFGGCLADDMGTGKTIAALAFLQSLKERGQAKRASLLVVPRSLVFNWEREAARFTPRLRLLNHAMAERAIDVSDFDDYDLVVTTYGVLLRDIEMLMHYEFEYAILDEAQAIKNPNSESAKAARLLRTAHKLTLTGTPVENNTLELWSQFAFLNPGLLGSADFFREEFATPIERKGDEAAAQMLRKMVYPFILRRTKDQVAKELPARTERQLVCDMEPAQRKLYNDRRDYYRALLLKLIEDEGIKNARFKVLEGLLRLRQICNHPRLVQPTYKGASAKFELLMETLATLHAEGHKALVFSQFVQMLKLVEAELKRRKLPFAYLDGKTTNRQARVDEFQNDPAIPFFLISLKAGGVGLNLTAADYVIHIDPWWNPAVEMQATDRTHRIGQDKPVFVYKLIVRDSVEEKIVQLQERKRALVTQLIATESGFFKNLTADDIKTLFS